MLNQFIPVVLGVYLGIVASNWNENRTKKAEQKEFIQNLYLEVEANQTKIKEAMAYRQAIFSSARKVRQELDQNILQANFWSVGHWNLLPEWKGIHVPTLESSVYQSGVMGNTLSGLDFQLINSIARVYNQQEDYQMWVERLILDKVSQFGSEIKTVEALGSIERWHDVINKEKELLHQYEQTLRVLNE